MNFEIHITVDCDDFNRFAKICGKVEANPLWIQNARGRHSRQMLCAINVRNMDLAEAEIFSKKMVENFQHNGFKVIREKIECPLGKSSSKGVYHECHIKMIRSEAETETILKFCDKNGLAASWSLIYRIAGQRKWYLTIRDYKNSSARARRKFLKKLDKVKKQFGKISGAEMETAIFDSNQKLDLGWA